LTSGKLQGVQENIEQAMQLISATPGARIVGINHPSDLSWP